jgi:hypothetical protein
VQVFSLSSLVLLLLVIIAPFVHSRLPLPHEVCGSSDQATHYHTLGLMLGASSLTRHLVGLGVKWYYLFIWRKTETAFNLMARPVKCRLRDKPGGYDNVPLGKSYCINTRKIFCYYGVLYLHYN